MIQVFNGAVYDVDTNAPVTGAKIYSDTNPGVITDDTGNFSLMADDGNLSEWYHIDATAKGYGDYVQQLDGLHGDFFIYQTSSGGVSKIKAFAKNSLLGILITAAVILIILFIAKKYLQNG